MSLKYRIALTIFVLEAIMIGLVLWRTLDLTSTGFYELSDSHEATFIDLLAAHCRPGMEAKDHAELQAYIDLVEDPHVGLILLADARDRVVAASDRRFVGSDLLSLNRGPEEHWLTRRLQGTRPLGSLAVRFSESHAHTYNRKIRNNALLIAGAGMTLIGVVALLMGNLLTRRLGILGKAVRRLEGGDLTTRVGLQGDDEVSKVGRAFDEMARSFSESLSALQEKEAQMRLLTDSLPVGISYVDPDLRIRFVNHQLAKWMGWNREVMIGRPLQDLVDDAQFAVLRDGLEAARRGNIVHRERSLPISGRRAIMDVVDVPDIGSDGAVRGVYSLLRDVSSNKARELERERLLAELANKNSELEQFTYSVSHDLKSPLLTILGSAEYLADEVSSDHGTEDLHRIRHAAETMGRMLDELLDLARLGGVQNRREEVDLGEVAEETVRLLAGRIASRKAEVEIHRPFPTVLGDRRRLQRMLQNLVDNGIKFTPTDRRPRLEIGARPVAPGDSEAICWVRDRGVGIARDQTEKIFELFRQVDRKQEGTGVGLAIVQRIVEGHGGRVWVESEGLDLGSTFYFSLSLASG